MTLILITNTTAPCLYAGVNKYYPLAHIRVLEKLYSFLCNSNTIYARGSSNHLPLLAWG